MENCVVVFNLQLLVRELLALLPMRVWGSDGKPSPVLLADLMAPAEGRASGRLQLLNMCLKQSIRRLNNLKSLQRTSFPLHLLTQNNKLRQH